MSATQISELPDWDGFPVYWVAKRWHLDRKHLCNLIEAGEFGKAIDFRGASSSRSTIRIPRAALIAFLERRKIGGHNGQSLNGKNGSHK
jgi:hypothetical protein